MSLDAFVRCNCIKEGKAKLPPFPVIFDAAGDAELAPEDHDADHQTALRTWKWCEHDRQAIIRERLSSWPIYRLFQQSLHQIGLEHFPTLQAEVPDTNGGQSSPEAAKLILGELNYFDAHVSESSRICLFDVDVRTAIVERIDEYFGFFAVGRFNFAVDERGFFITNRTALPFSATSKAAELRPLPALIDYKIGAEGKDEAPRELFRALWFQKEKLPTGEVKFTNETIGESITVSDKPYLISMGNAGEYFFQDRLRNVGTTIVPFSREYFEDLTSSLREVCEASIATNNPIQWT